MRVGELVGLKQDNGIVEEVIIVDLDYKKGRRAREKVRVFVISRLVYEEVDVGKLTRPPIIPRILPNSVTSWVLLDYIDRHDPASWIRRVLGRNPLVTREVETPLKWQRRKRRRTRRIRVRRRLRRRR